MVASINQRGRINRVTCPKCGTRSTLKSSDAVSTESASTQTGAPYDQRHTYRTGQKMWHPTYGSGEVTALIEPSKIDMLFLGRLRPLIHAQVQLSAHSQVHNRYGCGRG